MKYVKYALLLGIAGIFLWFSFKGVKWAEFIEDIKGANYYWIVLSMITGVLAVYIRALRWRLIMLPFGKAVKTADAFDGLNVAYLTNFVLPRAGEITRCGVISRKNGLPFETVAGTVVLERSVDLLSLALITLSIFFFSWERFGLFMEREILSAAENRFSSGLLWITLIVILSSLIFMYIVYRYRKSSQFFRKIAESTKRVIHGAITGFKMQNRWLFLLYTALLWLCYWVMSWSSIQSFDSLRHLTYMDALFLMMVGSFGWLIPVQGGIGAYHFIISLALTAVYAIPQTTGMVFATISHESQAITMLICGVVSMLRLKIHLNPSRQ